MKGNGCVDWVFSDSGIGESPNPKHILLALEWTF
jgi:hypothetical protein